MASVKLTDTLRNDIVQVLLGQGGFYKVEETKKKAYVEACHAFYFNVFKSYLSSFAFINKGFFQHFNNFCINFDTSGININEGIYPMLRRGYKLLQVDVPDGYPSPVRFMTLEDLGITYEDTHLQAILTARKALSDELFKQQEAYDKAMRVLISVNTTSQLLKVWADIEPILDKVLPPQKTTNYTTSEPIPDLSKSFGLVK